MFFGTFTERPYQDDRLYKKMLGDLVISNENYDPRIGAELYERYIDEKVYTEEMGFDALWTAETGHDAFFPLVPSESMVILAGALAAAGAYVLFPKPVSAA